MLSAISAGITQILNARNTYHGEHLILDIRNIMIISSISLILMACPLLAPSFFSTFWFFLKAHPITTPILLISTTVLVSYTMHLNMLSSFPEESIAPDSSKGDDNFLRKPDGWPDVDIRSNPSDDNISVSTLTSEDPYPWLQPSEEDILRYLSTRSRNGSEDSLTDTDEESMLDKTPQEHSNNFKTPLNR
jgi:hypothetical protein